MYSEETETSGTIPGQLSYQGDANRKSFIVDFDVDWKFFAILPALNINLHVKGFEFEWLFFGVYIRKA